MRHVKMLVVYEKKGALRFIGHLDLQRAMQRALRRSGLPVCYSQGFNPHLLLSFAAPLVVGVEGEREIMELPLSRNLSATAFLARLNPSLPEGLKARDACPLQDTAPAAMARVFAAQYSYRFDEQAEGLLAKVPAFLQQSSIPFQKQGKAGTRTDDLRPMIFNLLAREGQLKATLALGSRGTARPDQLLESLSWFAGIKAPPCRITRRQLLADRLQPLETALAQAYG